MQKWSFAYTASDKKNWTAVKTEATKVVKHEKWWMLSIVFTAESDICEIAGHLGQLDRPNLHCLGLCLGLRHSSIKDMMHSETYREDMIAAWLRREGDVDKKTGVPTWRTLVKESLEEPLSQTRWNSWRYFKQKEHYYWFIACVSWEH